MSPSQAAVTRIGLAWQPFFLNCCLRAQLTGNNLVPFTFDKQILFIDSILSLFL